MQSIQVEKSQDKQFDLSNCFENAFDKQNSYQQIGEGYFDGYSHFSIHEEMLKDRVRTEAYEKAIMNAGDYIKDKIVLDVGCGTGILSIFAARAGAKHVYAVDNANIVFHTREIIKQNGYEDRITVIKGKMEEIELPVEKVDVIISEWMGYLLLYESMLDTVLFARDKWLGKEGILLPDRCAMFVATIEDEEYKEEKINFWDSVYNVNMNCIKRWALMEPLVDTFNHTLINSESQTIFDIDLKTVTIPQLQFCNAYSLKITRKDTVYALTSWFDVYFSFVKGNPIVLSTSPYNQTTHWKQVVFYLEKPLPVNKDDVIHGSIALRKNHKNPRHLDIKISYHLQNSLLNHQSIQFYKLA